jgi:hypothetical protein
VILTGFFAALIALICWSVWRAAERLRDYFIIVFCAIALLPLVATSTLTGDMSRHFPAGTFAHGFEGKDQIIIVSVTTTILIALMLAALLVRAAKFLWRRLQATSSSESD